MRAAVLVIFMAAILFGCKSDADRQREQAMTIPTPLEHDPIHDFELAQWWSNDDYLLRLNEDSSYRLYEGKNRYRKPIERGRWAQQSYALLWLEPYNTRHVQRRRVTISRIDGTLALKLYRFEPMFALAAAPPALEDEFIGVWQGPLGSLQLRDSMHYVLTAPQPDSITTPIGTAGHAGVWRLEGRDALVLDPDSPMLKTMTLTIRRSDAAQPPLLEGPDGPMRRADAPRP